MGIFGKSNKCPHRAKCPTEEICSYVAAGNYQDCSLYEDWSGGGVNSSNSCQYKFKCSDYPYNCLFGEDPEQCFRYGILASSGNSSLSSHRYDDDDEDDYYDDDEDDDEDDDDDDDDEEDDDDDDEDEDDEEEEEDDDEEQDDEDDDKEDDDDIIDKLASKVSKWLGF